MFFVSRFWTFSLYSSESHNFLIKEKLFLEGHDEKRSKTGRRPVLTSWKLQDGRRRLVENCSGRRQPARKVQSGRRRPAGKVQSGQRQPDCSFLLEDGTFHDQLYG